MRDDHRPPSESGVEPRGLLHVELDYPTELLEELHDWYNTEHVPERLGIPGFRSARRFAALEGGPRWLALYEIEQPAVLDTDAYRYWRGAGETNWTRRVLPRNRGFGRTVYELVSSEAGAPGEPRPPSGPPGLFSVRLSGVVPEPAGEVLDPQSLVGCPGLDRARLYRDTANPSEQLLLCELSDVWAVQQPEFRRRWSQVMLALGEAAASYSRGLYVRIL